jgi:hypothetical protein
VDGVAQAGDLQRLVEVGVGLGRPVLRQNS